MWRKLLLSLLAIILVLLVILGTHEGRYQFFKTSARLTAAGIMPTAIADIATKVSLISTIVACKGDYGVCGRSEIGQFFARQSGPDAGYALGFGPFKFFVSTHDEYVKWIYSQKLRRSSNIFIGAKLDQIYEGIIPHNTLLNLGTHDPEHTKRRQLLSDAITSLARHPSRPALVVPSWADKSGDSDLIMKLTGLNIFRWMFDIELEDMHLDMLLEFNRLSGPIALGLGSGDKEASEAVQNIVGTLKNVIRKSETGTRFMSLAKERNLDSETRLIELTSILMFAGFGGTSAYAVQTIDRIRSDPALYVPLYLKDKVAFLKESARLNPPVGGIVLEAHKDHRVTVGGDLAGTELSFKKGELGVLWIPSANKDPKVFGGPEESTEYAFKFDPARPNLNKIMTWNGLLDDIERGWAPNTKGHSPRACPGAVFALQIVEKVVDYFLPGPDGKHEEL